jgi:hypothetical protein
MVPRLRRARCSLRRATLCSGLRSRTEGGSVGQPMPGLAAERRQTSDPIRRHPGVRTGNEPMVLWIWGQWLVDDERCRSGERRCSQGHRVPCRGSPDPRLDDTPVQQPPLTCRSIVQIVRQAGGNASTAIRRSRIVRARAYVDTDTSLTSSLNARARAWEEGVSEGHFADARSSSKDREDRRSRA